MKKIVKERNFPNKPLLIDWWRVAVNEYFKDKRYRMTNKELGRTFQRIKKLEKVQKGNFVYYRWAA